MTASGSGQPPESFEPSQDYPTDPSLPPPGFPPPLPGPPNTGFYQGFPGYQGYPGYPPPGTNGKAVASLVTSLAGVLCCGLPSIVGLVLGIIAMGETRRTGQDGWGLALAGVIIGALVVAGILLYLLGVALLVVSDIQWAP